MIYYKQFKYPNGAVCETAIQIFPSTSIIPFDPANTDYANFKAQILADEAQLQDAEGSLMTPQDAKDFVKELP